MGAKSLQLCPTLCDHMDCNPPGSSVHGDSPRQEYWSGLPCPPPGDLPNPGIEPRSPGLQVDSLLSEPPGKARYSLLLSFSSKQMENVTALRKWMHCLHEACRSYCSFSCPNFGPNYYFLFLIMVKHT